MSFPVSPTNGQIAVVNNVAYEYATANTSWTRVLSIANIIQANVISANVLNVVQAFSITGNIATGNYFIGNGAFLTGIAAGYGNADVANYLPTYTGNLVSLTGPVTTTGNITANNVLFGTGVVSGTGTVYAATVSTTGNVNSGFLSTGPASVGNLISGGFVSATGNVTGSYIFGNGALLTGVITSVSNINNGTSNVTVVSSGGNVTVGVGGTGNVAVFATTGEYVTGLISASGNITGGNLITGGLISATGNITGGNILGGANVNATTHTGTTVSVSANVTGGNILTGGLISATGNITGGNLRTAGIVSATGNVTGGNVNAGNITIAGDLISSLGETLTIDPATVGNAGLVVINGNLQVNGTTTTINSNVVSTNDLTVNYANNAINASAANGGGIEVGPIGSPYITWLYNSTANVWTSSDGISAVGNVTSGNILTSGLISATGNITGGNLRTAGLVSATGAITGAGITGTSLTVSTGNITAGNLILSGAIIDSAQLDIQTSASNANIVLTPNGTGNVNTGANLSVTGNIQGGNLRTAGLISATGNITGGNVLGGANVNATTHTGTTVSVTANITGGNLLTSGLISAAGTITTSGNISLIGNIVDTGALWINTTANGNITLNANGTGVITFMNPITNGQANGVGNIGNSTGYFNTVFAKATSAQYADLAEMYVADADYAPGTVLEFGGNNEVTISNTAASALIAGVVSTNPAHLMNSTAQGKHLAAIALVGRVPTQVIGPVSKGAMMVSAGNGYAQACATPAMGTVIGKAVEDFTGKSGTIEIAVGRL